jgi:replicative DNA helicase
MSGDLSADDWDAYNRVHAEMQSRKNIAINDVKAISPAAIGSEIRRFEPDIVFLDYLQLATSNAKTERRHEQVSAVARELKNLAGQFSVPVVAAAQINRDTKRNDNARPQLQNLAESAGLEQAADNVFFLHRPDEMDMRTQVIVAKRRNGPVGEVTLMYVPSKTRFQSMP